MPLLAISPYAKVNYVDHTVTDQSSILRFIEDNWSLGRIGNNSTDAIAGTLNGMFNFQSAGAKALILDLLSAEFRRRAAAANLAFNPGFAGAALPRWKW